MNKTCIKNILQKAENEIELSCEEAFSILDCPDEYLDEIILTAFKIRRKYKGLNVEIQILSNAKSGNCSENCFYCSQSASSKSEIEKYSLISFEKLSLTSQIAKQKKLSRHCIGLSGIYFSDKEIDDFAKLVREIKSKDQNPICCSIGFLTEEQAQKLKNAGVNRINHNLNTSRSFYPKICSTHTYDQRLQNIERLQNIGFEICCGALFGLGEKKSDVVELLFELKRLKPESVPINFLIPIKGSIMEKADVSYLTCKYCLKILSLARFLIPKSSIRCAAGREIYFKDREKDLLSIVDSIFASGYLTAEGESVDNTVKLIEENGFSYCI
ncbi:MAG: biotin synthase BioB [Elusimicrobiota bacterium]|jgi:biotin synthase|nr:biotin synthase BioB [Elusimicrobiota bacterium]